jgi:triacylglycerol esterase/lipase EstA (alpha/beta hydrolase family)
MGNEVGRRVNVKSKDLTLAPFPPTSRGVVRSSVPWRLPGSFSHLATFLKSILCIFSLSDAARAVSLFFVVFFVFSPWLDCTAEAKNYDPSPADSMTQLIDNDFTALDNRIPLVLIHGIHGVKDWNNDGQLQDYEAIEQLAGWDNFLTYYQNSADLKAKFKVYRFAYLSDQQPDGTVWQIARALRNKIDDQIDKGAFPDTQIVILAHSMGGLVARSYMEQHHHYTGLYNGTVGGDRVLNLITLATPHHGSPGANHDSRSELAFNADVRDIRLSWGSFWGIGNDWGTVVSASSAFYWTHDWDHVSYNEPNRKDLLWDNFDGIMPANNNDINSWLSNLNTDSTYHGKLIVYLNGHFKTGQ